MREENQDKVTHSCGCVTIKCTDRVMEIFPCEMHKVSGYVWIALQHDKKKEIETRTNATEDNSIIN